MKSKIIKVDGHDIRVWIAPPNVKTFQLPSENSNEIAPKFINESKLMSGKTYTRKFSDGNTYLKEYEILKPKDQGRIGSCTAHSLSYNLEMAYARKHNNEYKPFSTDFIQGNRQVYDDHPVNYDDDGLNVGEAICHLIKYGDVPNEFLDTNSDASDARNKVAQDGLNYKLNAKPYRILGAIDIQHYSVDRIKNLMNYGDVVVECAIQYTCRDNHVFSRNPNEKDPDKVGSHALCLIGWGNDGWKVFNSWGESKERSIYTIPFDYKYFRALYAIQLSGIDPVDIYDYDSPHSDVYHCTCHNSNFSKCKYDGYFNSRENAIKCVERLSSTGDYISLSGGLLTKPNMGFEDNKITPLKHSHIFAGSDMEEQARIIAKLAITYKKDCKGVIIANKNDFPDIIAATALSYQMKYPMIVTDNNYLSKENREFIQNATDKELVILGGPSVLSDNLFRNLGVSTRRIFGEDRYASAVAIGDALVPKAQTAILLNGDDYPDGICLSGYAASYEYGIVQIPWGIPDHTAHIPYPILYTTNGSYLNADTKAALKKWHIRKVIVVGSTSLIPSSQENELNNMNIQTTRLSGGFDRYNSSAIYANNSNLFKDRNGAILVNGSSFDKCAFAGILSSWIKWPVLLCDGTSFDSEVKRYIDSVKRQTKYNIYTASPSSAISQGLLNYLDD